MQYDQSTLALTVRLQHSTTLHALMVLPTKGGGQNEGPRQAAVLNSYSCSPRVGVAELPYLAESCKEDQQTPTSISMKTSQPAYGYARRALC